jgi:hypothetical protein
MALLDIEVSGCGHCGECSELRPGCVRPAKLPSGAEASSIVNPWIKDRRWGAPE